MIRYMSYLYANVRKKWSTYLIPLFAALILMATLLPAILTNKTDASVLGNALVFYYFVPFVFGAMFVGIKALNIFKDGEDDGTELLIVSKPISRSEIVIGKFLTLYSLIAIYALWSFITTIVIGSFDKNSSASEIVKFAGGYALGSFIIMIIFSAVITFFASFLGKIGTMALSIVVPAMLPIVSFILVPVGNGSLSPNVGSFMSQNRVFHSSTGDEGQNILIQDPTYIYDDSNPEYKTKLQTKQDGFYKYVSYGDVWQHLFGLYSMLKPQTLGLSSQGVKIIKGEKILTDKDGIVLTNLTGQKYLYMLNASDNDIALNGTAMSNFMKLINENGIKFEEVSNSTWTFDGLRDNFVNQVKAKAAQDPKFLAEAKTILGVREEEWNYQSSTKYLVANLANQDNVKISDLADQAKQEHYIMELDGNDEKKLQTLKIEKYHDQGTIIAVYSILAILLSGLVIFRYYKRDFK